MPRIPFCSGKARAAVLVLPLFFTLVYFLLRSPLYDTPNRAPNRHASVNHKNTSDWWVEFFTRLENTRVTAAPTEIDGRAPDDNWTPDTSAVRPDLLKLTAVDEAKFRDSHASFVRQLPPFASHLPYDADTTGIVSTAGAPNFGQAISMVLMTRQSGSRLPIQIVVDSTSPWVESICAETFPRLNATCLFMEDAWAGMPQLVPKLHRFQWKFISIIASTFQNVLFLDADCLPVRSPDHIFSREPFVSAGLITWPDYWVSQAAPGFYKIAGDVEVPPITARASSESGMMVYDKARHADTLLLAAYYNYNGPDHYYAMLNQHGPGEGDKETFFQAALVLDALRKKGVYHQPTAWMKPGVGVKKGYWDVKTMPKSHGRTAKGNWRGMFMQQMDPTEDYRAVMAAVEKAKKGEDEKKSSRRTRRWLWKSEHKQDSKPPPPPQQSKSITNEPAPQNKPLVESDYLTDSTFLATVGNLTLESDHHHFMFFHHNGVKPDLTGVTEGGSEVVATDEDEKYLRMWGDPGWIIDRYGRDVEKVLWHDSIEVYCQPGLGEFERLQKVCARMREIYEQVYV
jgi:alpha 1,2-mannosyltransferase